MVRGNDTALTLTQRKNFVIDCLEGWVFRNPGVFWTRGYVMFHREMVLEESYVCGAVYERKQ